MPPACADSRNIPSVADARQLACLRRAYKIRDVFEEMDLCGVPPAALMYFRVIFACMKARRLGDTLYYWHRMQRAGIVPDVSALFHS
jgi:pentatricopeptide repeat protein